MLTASRKIAWDSAIMLGLAALGGCGQNLGGGGAPTDAQPEGAPDAADRDAGDSADAAGFDADPGECDALPDPPGDVVVDLGDEGLAPGDLIDPYLEDWVQDGNEVHIPAGRYLWEGDGFTGKSLADASVIGDGDVIFDAGDGYAFSSNFVPDGGDFELRNITIRGTRAAGEHKIRVFVPDPDATLTFRNVNQPDGSEDDSASGIFVNKRHAGAFYLIDAHIEGFADNGLYASSPSQADGGNGVVHVVRGLFKNNNISNVRVGTDGSSVVGAVIVQDAPSPSKSGSRNQRGLRVRQHATGDDILIQDVHITQTQSGNGALVVEGDDGGSGTITGARIRNDVSTAPVRIRTADSVWTGTDIEITGSGERDPAGGEFTSVCTGDGCDEPITTKPPPCI